MNPFLLSPVYKDYIWGGNKLINNYNKKTNLSNVAESWELSAHPDGDCTIFSGEFKGMKFSEFVTKHKTSLGKNYNNREEFPILIKFIDAKESLSVQVHPDDDYARKTEGCQGKTEMWHILDCEPDSFIYCGFDVKVGKDEIKRRVEDGSITEILHKEYVRPGDTFFIEAGTVHAIGANIIIAEIQQNSNATYRLYDYRRKDASGKLRELHIDKAFETLNINSTSKVNDRYFDTNNCRIQSLVNCSKFKTDRIICKDYVKFMQNSESFISIICIDGSMNFRKEDFDIVVKKGDSLFVPSEEALYTIKGEGELLFTTI